MPNKKNRAGHSTKSSGTDRRKFSKEVRGPKLEDILPVEAGGVNYTFEIEPRCKVCQKGNEFLSMVNALLATGASYTDVLRSIKAVNDTYPESKRVTYSSLRNHQKQHLPYDSYAIREITERRASTQRRDFIAGAGTIIDPASYAETMMFRAFNSLTNPAVFVEPRDGLAAAKVLYSIHQGEERDQTAIQAYAELNRIVEAVKAVVPKEYYAAITAHLNSENESALEKAPLPVVEVPADEYEVSLDDEWDDETL